MKIRCKKAETVADFIDAIRLRVNVFIKEQKSPTGWEPDELDKVSEHYIAVADTIVVGTLRVREDPKGARKIE